MNNKKIRWRAFQRDVLPEALFGLSAAGKAEKLAFDEQELLGGSVVAGFADARAGAEYNPPCVFVVNDDLAAETFSWLKVYAPETSPLSQFGRVVSAEDWRRFSSPDTSRQNAREDKWASIIVGEALALGDVGVELSSLPLSRTTACFSSAIARAASVYGTDEATRACAARLKIVEADRRFIRRSISVSDLLPIWALTGVSSLDTPLSLRDAVEFVLAAAERYASDAVVRRKPSAFASLDEYPEFTSDSIEDRVLAFHKLAQKLMQEEQVQRSCFPAALLAAAAFLVGRSTSHEFLLRRVGRAFPAAPVWFGLLAALVGVESWEPDWTRATKIVERQVRVGFDWADASGFDLCWTEFFWLASTFDGLDVFSSLPRLMSGSVSVEILPGATCQLKLAVVGRSEPEARVPSVSNERERELQAALSQFVVLAARTRQLLDGQSNYSQRSLDFEEKAETYARGNRPKKPR